jgi:hypothetical protein
MHTAFAYPYTNAAVNYSAGSQPYGIVSADFNGDGFPDLAIADFSGNNVTILLNNGHGQFPTAVTYPVDLNPRAIIVGDFNGDGKLDLATANASSNDVSVLLGHGDGTFGTASNYPTDGDPWAIYAADVNKDGKLDLITAGGTSGVASVLLNNGDGTFGSYRSYNAGSSARGVFLADFNGDGYPDMAVVNQVSNTMDVYINNGSGIFGSPTAYTTGSGPRGISGVDLNGDGKIDLVTANFGGSTSVFLGNGNGTFGTATSYTTGSGSLAVLLSDVNGDGHPDIEIANYSDNDASVLLNNGNGTFASAVNYAAGTNPRSMTVAQLDNFDNVDFAVANGGSNNVTVYLSSGSPVVYNPPSISVTSPAASEATSSTVTLAATASEVNGGIAGVTFYVNGVRAGSEDTSAPYSVAWDSTATSSGSKTVVAVARDTSNEYATSTGVNFTVSNTPPDTTPPVISAIASTTNQTTATIVWTTDESASSTVQFGTSSSYGTASTSALLVTSHSILLTGLTAGTIYHYQIRSADASNNVATSSDLTFTTAAAPSIDPVGYWPLDETSSSANAVDAIATNTGIQTGTPGTSTDVPNVNFTDPGSRSFNGSNYFTISRPVQNNFSICAWIKTTSTGGGTNHWQSAPIMDSEVSGLANDFGFGIGNGGRLMFGNGGSFDSQVNGTTVINDNKWHNACVTRNGTSGDVYLYVDAHVDGNGTTSPGTLNQNPNARIGYGYDGAANYVGLIDDLRAYGTDLSPSEVLSIFQGNSDPSTPPDTTPPAITNIATSSSSTSATITWTTDEAASTKVVYSVNAAYASSTGETDLSPRVLSHSASASGLHACTSYNYEVVSADAAGNYATSSSGSFITAGCPGSAPPTQASSASVSVASAATSTLSDSGRMLTVATPANFTATTSSVVIQIKSLSSDTVIGAVGKPSANLSSAAGVAFDVIALVDNTTVLDSFDAPVTITYHYTDADISGLDESSLAMYHYHDGAWLPLDDCSVDMSADTITCSAPSFSVFAIFGTPAASNTVASNDSGGAGLPWCSGPSAPGWNTSLVDGGCSQGASSPIASALPVQVVASSSISTSRSTPALCPYYHFTGVLRFGSQGADVRALQEFLNCAGFTLADSGPGSPGDETIYFSDRTRDALIKFQQAYRSEVLTPVDSDTGTGIFAQYSAAKAYSLMQPQ